ncbi:MAG: MBL fold metallo-hydrolase, partial [Thermoleophilaceae bacterium]
MIAEAQPAHLPLPGGREGATVRLQPLNTGELTAPPAWFEREEGRMATLHAFGVRVDRSNFMRLPMPAFLVEHPGAGPLLIDTGLHPSVAVDPKQNFGRLLALGFRGLEMTQEQSVPAQLRARGLDAADIGYVLMTHMHVDHASAISEFPDATFVLAKQEWDALKDGKVTDGYVKSQYDFGFDYRTFDFDSKGTDSFASFGRSFDLFG